MQHGAGQSYGGDSRTARHPCYAGGDDNDDVGLFLVPNEHAGNRWRERYPQASVEVVGCPILDELPSRAVSSGTAITVEKASPVVAVSFHWNYHGIPEMRSAFDWYSKAVVELAKEVTVIGHGHPQRKDLPDWYRAHGIEYVPDFSEVCRRADVYACDNSSTLYEFASTGRTVVVLNAPWYRQRGRARPALLGSAVVGVQCRANPTTYWTRCTSAGTGVAARVREEALRTSTPTARVPRSVPPMPSRPGREWR